MHRGLFITLWVLSVVAPEAWARLDIRTEDEARRQLAQKLKRFTQDLDLKEASFRESRSGGKDTNANDGNSFTSNTTYHSNVWDYCTKWMGGRVCEDWVHPYVSLHGAGGDRSPLEGEMYAEAKGASNGANGGGGGGGGTVQFNIWEVSADGSFLNSDGTLNRKSMTSWKLNQKVKKKAQKVGEDTASRQIARGQGQEKNVMIDQESLRLMAGRWTKMARNRLIANIGEIRAMQPGIEVAQNEELEDCNKYAGEIQRNMDRTRMEERIDPQNNLQIETRIKKLEERLKHCRDAKKMNAYAVNVQLNGDKVSAGSAEGEWIDAALSRANLMAIDFAGVDPRKANIDGRIQISDSDIKSDIAVYEPGGKNMKKVPMTNAEQIQAYNRNLDAAAVGYKEAASRSYFVTDRSEDVVKHKIDIASINLVKLNDLTPEMRNELKNTEYPRANGSQPDPGDDLETEPTKLTVKQK